MSARPIAKEAWTVDDAIAGRVVINEGEFTIAELFGAAPVIEKRARLISAAPEMAEMAMAFTLLVERFVRSDLDDVPRPTETELAENMYTLRAFIARATGAAA